MPTIGIIDDREDFRTTLKRRILLSLKKLNLAWNIEDIHPFTDLDEYINWIRENDIAILIIDERLQEGSHETVNVNYNGSNLIDFIRKTLKEFPVYVITSYPNDGDLQSKFPLFDEILSRDEFFKKPDDYTLRFTRSAHRFLENYNKQLLRISEISNLIVTNKAKKEDIEELNSLQELLNIPFTSLSYANREEWLSTYQTKLKELSEVSQKIKEFIANTKK